MAFECQNCIGMPEYGCYCMAMGCIAPCTLPPDPDERFVPCDACGGDGGWDGYSCAYLGSDPWRECTRCGGTGKIETRPVTLADLEANES